MQPIYKVYRLQYDDMPDAWGDTIIVVCLTIFNSEGKPTVGVIAEEFTLASQALIDESSDNTEFSECDPLEMFEYHEILSQVTTLPKLNTLNGMQFNVDDVEYKLQSMAYGLLHDKIDGYDELQEIVALHGSSDPDDVQRAESLMKGITSDIIPDVIFKIGNEIINTQ